MGEMQKECGFDPGEFVLVAQSSFSVFGWVTGAKSVWTVHDAAEGLLAEGKITVAEALAVVRPSVWAGYESRCNKPITLEADSVEGAREPLLSTASVC